MLYNSELSDQENINIFVENGIKISMATFRRYKKEMGLSKTYNKRHTSDQKQKDNKVIANEKPAEASPAKSAEKAPKASKKKKKETGKKQSQSAKPEDTAMAAAVAAEPASSPAADKTADIESKAGKTTAKAAKSKKSKKSKKAKKGDAISATSLLLSGQFHRKPHQIRTRMPKHIQTEECSHQNRHEYVHRI